MRQMSLGPRGRACGAPISHRRQAHLRLAVRAQAGAAQAGADVPASSGGRRTFTGCRLIGVGACAPDTVITNDDLSTLGLDTNDEWISTRTGIRRRHVLGKGETLTDLAEKASNRALEMAGVKAEEIDLVLFATSSPDDVFGSACQVRRRPTLLPLPSPQGQVVVWPLPC